MAIELRSIKNWVADTTVLDDCGNQVPAVVKRKLLGNTYLYEIYSSGEKIGSMMCGPDEKSVFVGWVGNDSEKMRHVGKALLDEAFLMSERLKLGLELETSQGSAGFYIRYGFEPKPGVVLRPEVQKNIDLVKKGHKIIGFPDIKMYLPDSAREKIRRRLFYP